MTGTGSSMPLWLSLLAILPAIHAIFARSTRALTLAALTIAVSLSAASFHLALHPPSRLRWSYTSTPIRALIPDHNPCNGVSAAAAALLAHAW